jgi:predicted DCC family thiol-disulfide oxidoreductase YuxK
MKKISFRNSGSTEITEIREDYSPEPDDDRVPESRPAGTAGATPSLPLCQNQAGPPGWILYDGECRHCIAAAKRFDRLFARRDFRFVPLQTPWVQKRLGLRPGAPLEEMRVLTKDNEDLGGVDAVTFLARKVWWTWPVYILAQLPGAWAILDRAYRWIAAHRGCTHYSGRDAHCLPRRSLAKSGGVSLMNGTGQISSFSFKITPWLGLIILPPFALLARTYLNPWVFMWLIAGALFFGCKWLTFWRAKRQRPDLNLKRAPAYFLLWAGMDAVSFLGPHPRHEDVARQARGIILATIKILFGASLLFGFARLFPNQLLVGWIGMIGMILILHFGLFDLAAISWRSAGVNAQPIMAGPIKSTSLGEFWGRRWNGAFHQLVLNALFRPLARSAGAVPATFATFLLSGLLHELVISLPAAAGYGLPTAYFLSQAWGVIAQRSEIGSRLHLRDGGRGWLFTMLIAAGPAFWLFHPPFIRNVILPFMKAIGAL